ncbi:unnamed protein product, partial [Durusdinium trenchii]
PKNAQLHLCIPFADGAKIKAEIVCSESGFQDFVGNAAERATVRWLTEVEKEKDIEARVRQQTKKRVNNILSNAEFAQKLVNDYPAGGKHAKKRRLLAQAMEVVTCGNLAHDAVHGNRVDGVGGGDPPMAVAL